MKVLRYGLLLMFLSAGSLSFLAGCEQGNESGAGVKGTPPANAPSPEEYQKQMQKQHEEAPTTE